MNVIDTDVAPSYHFEDLEVGMAASHAKVITEADIVNFADISGDTNPLHLDDTYAETTMFKGRIAHGMLSAGLISAIFGTKMPGPGCVYVSQTLNFRAPVRIGDKVVARVEVKELIEPKGRAVFACTCKVGETTVIEGEAVILVPKRGSPHG